MNKKQVNFNSIPKRIPCIYTLYTARSVIALKERVIFYLKHTYTTRVYIHRCSQEIMIYDYEI